MGETAFEPALMARLAQAAAVPASCFAWPRAPGEFHVSCYSPAGPIQCCGHGLLAVAHVLHLDASHLATAHPLRSATNGATESARWPSENGAVTSFYLPNEAAPVLVEKRGENLWLMLPRLRCRAAEVPSWVEDVFAVQATGASVQPTKAALAGDETGYWVFEFDARVDLTVVQVGLEELITHTRRAVIITQAGNQHGYDFALRYFAPQYGVPEDAVTGSANRVLADYWNQRHGSYWFRAWQCSTGGGVVLSCLAGNSVGISGRIEADVTNT